MVRKPKSIETGHTGRRFLAVLVLLLAESPAFSAEFQIKTIDGQTVQGEYLGTEKEIVRLRSKYGLVQIPAADVKSMVRGGEGGVPGPKADAAPAGEAPPAFPDVKPPDILSLVATRSSA